MGGLPLDKDRAARIAEEHSIPFFLAMLLDIRGLTQPGEIQGMLGQAPPVRSLFDEGHGQGGGAHPPGHGQL